MQGLGFGVSSVLLMQPAIFRTMDLLWSVFEDLSVGAKFFG